MFTRAIVRTPPPTFGRGITTAELGEPIYDEMVRQHAAYLHELRRLGLAVTVLEPLPEFPDSHFVEDVAVVLPEVAVIANPGAPARRGEPAHIEPTLAAHRPVARIAVPGTLDGGDVLCVGRRVFVGVSSRTNREGAEQLAKLLSRYDYETVPPEVGAGLHLKSSVNVVGDDTLVVTAALANDDALGGHRLVVVDAEEEYAANVLRVNESVLVPAGFPRTREKIEALRITTTELEMSECRKMDGGLTCLSLRF